MNNRGIKFNKSSTSRLNPHRQAFIFLILKNLRTRSQLLNIKGSLDSKMDRGFYGIPDTEHCHLPLFGTISAKGMSDLSSLPEKNIIHDKLLLLWKPAESGFQYIVIFFSACSSHAVFRKKSKLMYGYGSRNAYYFVIIHNKFIIAAFGAPVLFYNTD